MEVLLLWIIMAAVVAIIANSKGLSAGLWFLYGAVIWPIALVHVLVKPQRESAKTVQMIEAGRVPCPHCAELIKPEARICPHCREPVTRRP